MKGQGRSHRPSSSEPDDWGDGSWIVDCACGVNFDDGEEMVSCDECGVWVHTRCSRFVKGETSFACDKCKIKKRRKEEESEETEVAQLLAELPTKTMRMESCPAPSFRMASEVRMEDRVHVQGIPGGDPELFEGLPAFYSRELWKCSGYVPKKLNFQYREFPCWDDKENIDVVPFLQSKMQIGVHRPVVLDDGSRGSEEPERVAVSEGRGAEDTEREIPVLASSKEKLVLHQGSQSRREDRHSSPRGEGSRRLEGKGHKHQHHHHHHHSHHQGKRKKEEGGGSRDNAGKKRAKTSGDKDRDENLKKKGSSSQDGGHTSRSLRSAPKNPKSMRNLAAQRFLDDGLKAHSGSCKVEPIELACHDSLFGGTHDKTEVRDCENSGSLAKGTSLDKREIKNEEYRGRLLQDTDQDGIFKKHDTQRSMEKLKLASASRIYSTEIPSDSFICTMSSEPQLKKDCQITGKAGKFSPTRESMKFHLEACKIATAPIKQEDLKISVEDASMSNAGKSTVDFESSEDPVVHAELAFDSEFAAPKSLSGNYPHGDAVPCLSITSPALNGGVASESAITLLTVKGEVNDEPAILDIKPLRSSNSNLTREKSLGEGCKQPQKASDPFACLQPRHLAVSGNCLFKQTAKHSGPVAKSRADDCMQSQKQQTLAQNEPEDNCQVVKDTEDFHVESRDNISGIELKSLLADPKQILTEDSHCQDDAVSEERQLKLEQSCHGGFEQAQSLSQQTSILLQEARLPPAHRPRFSMGSSLYTASAIALSMQVPSSKSPNGGSKSSSGAAHLHKNGVEGVGRTSGSSSVSRPPTSGPIAEGNSKSFGQGTKSSVYTVSSSPASKPVHPSKQRIRSGNSTEVMKDDAGNAVGKGSTTGSPGRVSPEISSSKSVPKDNVKCSTNSTGKTAPLGKSCFPGGASKQAASSPKGHSSCPSSKSSAGQNVPNYSSSTEHVVATHQQTLSVQTKHAITGTAHKNEKSSLLAAQSVLKATTAMPSAHSQASNSVPTTLSDEALALLLHQQLNSSPRVPRVPRVRHAGNIPQLASSSTPSSGTNVKRPTTVTPQCNSVSGQKDHNLVSRRRNREDNAREASRTVHGIDEPVNSEGLLSSPDTRRLEESNRADDLSYSTRRETPSRSSDVSCAANKNVASTSVHNMTEGSSHSIAFDSIDGHLSSVHASPGDMSDDAENTLIGGGGLTLPSLIDEILSKNQHMTDDELCEAVLPHWQNLRKHNGERYAYTSHCQAVLDCLRNRAVWAHRFDRGPKTGMGRKRRRIGAAVAVDSENDEEADVLGSIHEDEQHTGRVSKLHDVGSERSDSLASNRQKDVDITAIEDVPKGKRKARSRRPLEFKSREDMDEFKRSNRKDKQRYKTDGLDQAPQREEHEPFSHSSEDTSSNDSEDDNHNVTHSVRMHLASSDMSADELESTP